MTTERVMAMKKMMLLTTLAVGCMSFTIGAATNQMISANMKNQAVSYNGSKSTQNVIVYNDTTYVPLRAFSQMMGIPVDYRDNTIYLGNKGNSGQYIGKEKAEAIALQHAGLTKQQVGYIDNKLERDNGRWEYDIEFKQGRIEYNYSIDAYTGEILEYHVDRN